MLPSFLLILTFFPAAAPAGAPLEGGTGPPALLSPQGSKQRCVRETSHTRRQQVQNTQNRLPRLVFARKRRYHDNRWYGRSHCVWRLLLRRQGAGWFQHPVPAGTCLCLTSIIHKLPGKNNLFCRILGAFSRDPLELSRHSAPKVQKAGGRTLGQGPAAGLLTAVIQFSLSPFWGLWGC